MPNKVSDLLSLVADGNAAAAEELFPLVYDELRRLAGALMVTERPDHTLQPTALVHEAYLRLVRPTDAASQPFKNIGHFVATAAVVMRHLLVNHAKAKRAAKRSGQYEQTGLDQLADQFQQQSGDLIALDKALERLESHDPLQRRLVEMRFFGGMTVDQCAMVLNISPRSAYYEWTHARAWLRQQLEPPT